MTHSEHTASRGRARVFPFIVQFFVAFTYIKTTININMIYIYIYITTNKFIYILIY